jgi:uncharacterized protein (DUF1684 family)
MKSTYFFGILILAGVIAFVLYSLRGGPSPEDYAIEIGRERTVKDLFMKNESDSPFAGLKEGFQGLHYFSPDLKYKINANLVPIENKKVIALSTSDGLEKKYLEHAYAEFELDGMLNRLLILEITDPGKYRGTLFLAFADETSARETYGAGRYLELKKVPGASSVVLDFNKAYNPYCAYSNNFSCPFPPKENVLKVAIKAGEKSYH